MPLVLPRSVDSWTYGRGLQESCVISGGEKEEEEKERKNESSPYEPNDNDNSSLCSTLYYKFPSFGTVTHWRSAVVINQEGVSATFAEIESLIRK